MNERSNCSHDDPFPLTWDNTTPAPYPLAEGEVA